MKESGKPEVNITQLEDFLITIHGALVSDLKPMPGGFWSRAYSYEYQGAGYVIRLGHSQEGYRIDAAATRFANYNLPIPTVVQIGEALGLWYAISHRHHGTFIETIPARESPRFTNTMTSLLRAMRTVKVSQSKGVVWYKEDDLTSWRTWLLSGLSDEGEQVNDWRRKIESAPKLNALFERCEQTILELLPKCPERRDLVHGDLLHQNVLVAEQADEPSAVFSWKCSVLGDFLFDVAWCTLWSDWHPVISRRELWRQTLLADDLDETDLYDAEIRHHCYELEIAASHMGWFTWTEDNENLERLVTVTEKILTCGPLQTTFG